MCNIVQSCICTTLYIFQTSDAESLYNMYVLYSPYSVVYKLCISWASKTIDLRFKDQSSNLYCTRYTLLQLLCTESKRLILILIFKNQSRPSSNDFNMHCFIEFVYVRNMNKYENVIKRINFLLMVLEGKNV